MGLPTSPLWEVRKRTIRMRAMELLVMMIEHSSLLITYAVEVSMVLAAAVVFTTSKRAENSFRGMGIDLGVHKEVKMVQFFEVLQRMLMGANVVKNVNKNNASQTVLFEALAFASSLMHSMFNQL